MRNGIQIGAAVIACAVLAACSSSEGGYHTISRDARPTQSAYRASATDDAATIASHIPGCTGDKAADLGNGGPAMTSTASCTLTGHLIIVDVWRKAADALISPALVSTKYVYAHGDLWTAFVAEQGTTPATSTLQMQMTNDASGLMGQADNPPTPTQPAAQLQLARRIASALSGRVARTQ